MRTFIAGVAVVAVVVLLVGASFTGTPKSLSQIPLTQAFILNVGEVGKGWPIPKWWRLLVPWGVSVAVSRVETTGQFEFNIRVNGSVLYRTRGDTIQQLNPPILIPEGGTIEIRTDGYNSQSPPRVILAGYYLTPEDLGK